MKNLSRREFLGLLAVTGTAALLTGCSPDTQVNSYPTGETNQRNGFSQKWRAGIGDRARVVIRGVRKGGDPGSLAAAVSECALMASSFDWLNTGDRVLIKPSHNSGNTYPATSSPEAVAAMIKLLKDKGASKVIVSDLSGIEYVKLTAAKLVGSSRRLMDQSGMARAVLEAGGELYFAEEDGWDAFFEETPQDTRYWRKGIMMPKILNEVEHIINMPRVSRHPLLGSSLGLKSVVGYWRTDTRLEYHSKASVIQEMTADANFVESLRKKERLTLSAATKIITTMGPDNGFMAEPEVGLVIGAESIVAHDMVTLAWLLMNRQAMSRLELSKARDPYKNQVIVDVVNRTVAARLGTFGEAFKAETLKRNDIDLIWQDRSLNRAYELMGGIPGVELIDDQGSVPVDTRQQLEQMVTFNG